MKTMFEKGLRPSDLHRFLRYDAESGHLFWREREGNATFNKIWAGKRAFTCKVNGGKAYQGRIDGVHFMAHRVAWAMHHGAWPEDMIDHINGDPLDNRMVNLRCVSNAENARNMKRSKANTSGITGVAWIAGRRRWRASICRDRKQRILGHFLDKEDAIRARRAAEVDLGFHPNHGKTRSERKVAI